MSRSVNVTSGHVSPGMVSAPLNSRGIRPDSVSQSSLPRSAISRRVCLVGDDRLRLEGARAEHAHGVVVR